MGIVISSLETYSLAVLAPLLVVVVLEKGLHFLWAMFMVFSLADQPEQGLVALQPH